jgi:thiamine biosynthesis lipoprotein
MKQAKGWDRRAFLKLAGAAGVAAGLPLVSPALGLAKLDRKQLAAQASRMMMGTVVAVTVVDTSADRAQEALGRALAAMEELTPVFDRHAGSGPVRLLNAEGRLASPPPRLARVLELCRRVHQASGGAFDITVAPLLDAYKLSFAAGRRPGRQEVERALAAVGGLASQDGALVLTAEGAGVTLDGVAKGWVADAGLAAAKAAGARAALVNAGGDVAAFGRPWRVAVADPRAPEQAKETVRLDQGALATSGSYEVYFDRDKLFHHLINPATGLSARGGLSASVRAPSAAVADAFSTACFVMRPHLAMRLVRAQGLEALLYTKSRQRYVSEGFLG